MRSKVDLLTYRAAVKSVTDVDTGKHTHTYVFQQATALWKHATWQLFCQTGSHSNLGNLLGSVEITPSQLER